MTLRLAFVTQWYPPEPVDVPESIARALHNHGLEVDVLTGVPNYPSGQVESGYKAGRPTREIRNGLRVRRAPLYPSHDSSALRRVLNYVSWALSSSLFGQDVLRRADVALVYSSPATAALAPMAAKRLWKTPYVLLIQDVWPDSIFASGFMNRRGFATIRRLVDGFVRRAYSGAEHIVVISPGMVDLLEARGVPRDKISLVYNWLPESETRAVVQGADRSVSKLLGIPDNERVFLYAGNHGHAQALDALVKAFDRSETSGGHLVLMGDGVQKPHLQELAQNMPRVHFLPPVERGEAARLTRTADVHVVSLAPEPLFSVTMPSKVQSGLAAGLPMLVVAFGDPARTVVDSGAGVAADPGDQHSIAMAAQSLLDLPEDALASMGQRGALTYERDMAREVGAPRLAAIIENAQCRPIGSAMATPLKGS
jgi:colanic acid biosynthesis glycosyl transferase WcaI